MAGDIQRHVLNFMLSGSCESCRASAFQIVVIENPALVPEAHVFSGGAINKLDEGLRPFHPEAHVFSGGAIN
ncbi:hypothetical protein [Methylocystis sp. ATCC 49242]|uniref:hypothetical protein n=1 Tax=Methylocystis sp. ATCC 49242 TaxID=622637 RepID=UPI0011848F51|nr:hypothetical protein [Methylocystis sp. ATCC 49242]